MYRSIFFNCWVGLIAFTIYFISEIYHTSGLASPLPTIMFSLIWGLLGFVIAFGIQAFLNYILYTPEVPEVELEESIQGQMNVNSNHSNVQQTINQSSTIEFQDESSEDIAQVVRTMLHREEPFVEK